MRKEAIDGRALPSWARGSARRCGSIAGAWQEWPINEATFLVPLSQ